MKGDLEKEIRNLTRKNTIPLQYIPKEKLNSITGNSNHQGLAAQLALVDYLTIADVLPHIYEQGKTPAILVLDGIEDVRNIGALARSAVWFGIDAIVVGLKRTARINSFAFKASAGAIKDIPVCRETSMIKALQYLKDSGIKLIAADVANEEGQPEPDFTEPFALIMGSEGKGIVREIRQLADAFVTIPGTGKVESLNVSVAGAVLMYDIFKSRNKNNT